MIGGHDRAQKSHHTRDENGEQQGGEASLSSPRRNMPIPGACVMPDTSDKRQQASEHAAGQSDEHGFANIKPQDRLPCKSERLQHGHFAGAFADRHGHGGGRDQQRGENDRKTDAQNKCFYVADAVDEAKLESLFTFGFGGLRENCGTCRRPQRRPWRRYLANRRECRKCRPVPLANETASSTYF